MEKEHRGGKSAMNCNRTKIQHPQQWKNGLRLNKNNHAVSDTSFPTHYKKIILNTPLIIQK